MRRIGIIFALAGFVAAAEPADPKAELRADAMKRLRSRDPAEQYHGAARLHRLGAGVGDVPELIGRLKDDTVFVDVKIEIAFALARLGPAAAPACDALLQLSDSAAEDAMFAAREALVAIGPAAVDPIRKYIRFCRGVEGARGVVYRLVFVLLRIGAPAALRAEPELSELQRFDALAHLGDPDAPADLAAQLGHPNTVRGEFQISRIDADEFAERLAAQFPTCPDSAIGLDGARWHLAEEMACLGPAAVAPLRRLLDPRQRAITRILALRSLELMGPTAAPAIEEIIRALRSREVVRPSAGNPDHTVSVRAFALRAVAALGSAGSDAMPDIIDCLDDPDEEIRMSAMHALECLGPVAVDALPALAKCSERGSDGSALRAGWAHWTIDRRPELLLSLALNPKRNICDHYEASYGPMVLEALAEAVRRKPAALAGAALSTSMLRSLPEIVRRLDRVPPAVREYAVRGLRGKTPNAMAAAILTLEALGPAEVRAHADRILEMARLPADDHYVHDIAVAALVRVGDRRALPLLAARVRKAKFDDGVLELAVACGPAAHRHIPAIFRKKPSVDEPHRLTAFVSGMGALVVPHMLKVIAKNKGVPPSHWPGNLLESIEADKTVPHGDWLLRQWLARRDGSLRPAIGLLRHRIAIPDDLIPGLIRELSAAEGDDRVLAADLLSTLGPRGKPAVAALVKALSDVEPGVGWAAARALTAIGEPAPAAVATLLRWMDDEDFPEARRIARRALIAIAPRTPGLADKVIEIEGFLSPATLPATVPLLDRHFVRLAEENELELLAARAGEARAALPKLIEMFRAGHVGVTEALLAIGGKAVVPVLIEGLEITNHGDRRFVAQALGRLGGDAKPAVAALRAMLDDPQDWLIAMDELSHIEPAAAASALPKLIKLLELGADDWTSNGRSRIDLLALSERLGPAAAAAVPALTRRLLDIRWRIAGGGFDYGVDVGPQIAAIRALAAIGPKAVGAVPLIAGLLEAEVPELRVEAALALIRLGADRTRAVEVLREAARGQNRLSSRRRFSQPPNPSLRVRAIKALAELRDPQTEAILTTILETRFDRTAPDPNLFGGFAWTDPKQWDNDVSLAAVEALGKLGVGGAVLRKHAGDPKSPVRAEAAQALAAMGK